MSVLSNINSGIARGILIMMKRSVKYGILNECSLKLEKNQEKHQEKGHFFETNKKLLEKAKKKTAATATQPHTFFFPCKQYEIPFDVLEMYSFKYNFLCNTKALKN